MEELGTIHTKVCSKCKEDKEHSEYTKDRKTKSGLNTRCKTCDTIRHLESYEGRKWECFNYKGGKCEICGVIENADFYDFHHIVPENKEFNITASLMKKWGSIKAELDKCLMLCPNCHRKEHIRMRDDKAKDKTTE